MQEYSKGNIMLGNENEPLSALVFKCMNDKYVGSMAEYTLVLCI